jgi:pimeloyl-ACP methyl ester carboxylesterase
VTAEPHPVPITGITGGSEGMEATYAKVLALATTYDTAGNQMREWAGIGARTMGNGDLVESAILSPISFGEAEVAVLSATTGPDGVLVESLAWETDAILIRVTVRVFQEADDLVHGAFEVVDHLVGRMIGLTLVTSAPALLTTALTLGPLAYVLWQHLPPGLQDQLEDQAEDGGAALQDWLAEHPELPQHLINGGGGLLDGLWEGLTPGLPGGPLGIPTFTPDTESAAGLLAALYGDDGTYDVSPTDLSVPSGGTQPGTLADVLAHLSETSALSDADHPGNNGTVEIQTIRDGDGDIRHIVYLPGTDDMATLPWTQDGDVRDMATNFLLINGQDNAHLQGIQQAMHDAGIQPGDPVMLAGHSQGGMEAAAILSNHDDFNVTNVVTAGSPTAQVPGFPPGTHVISLENQGDVVPLLDGEENPDSPQQVTVHFDDRGSDIGDSHSLDHYTNGAAAVDASADQSLVEQLDSLHAHGYLGTGGQDVSSQVFQITRQP